MGSDSLHYLQKRTENISFTGTSITFKQQYISMGIVISHICRSTLVRETKRICLDVSSISLASSFINVAANIWAYSVPKHTWLEIKLVPGRSAAFSNLSLICPKRTCVRLIYMPAIWDILKPNFLKIFFKFIFLYIYQRSRKVPCATGLFTSKIPLQLENNCQRVHKSGSPSTCTKEIAIGLCYF